MARDQVLQFEPSYLMYGGGASFVMTIVIFKLIGPALSTRVTSKYKSLPKSTQADWDGRVTSNFNAAVSIAFSSYALLFEEDIYVDVVWHDSPYARLSCAILVGYAIGDLVTMLLWCQISNADLFGYVAHHAATVYAYYFVSVYGILCYFAMVRLIAEMSTPPVNQRWFFDVLNKPRSNLPVTINGFLMVLTFFIFRICTMPIHWYKIWTVTGSDEVIKLGYIQIIMYAPCLVLDSLNTYWFYKMCKGFIKAVKALNSSKIKAREVTSKSD